MDIKVAFVETGTHWRGGFLSKLLDNCWFMASLLIFVLICIGESYYRTRQAGPDTIAIAGPLTFLGALVIYVFILGEWKQWKDYWTMVKQLQGTQHGYYRFTESYFEMGVEPVESRRYNWAALTGWSEKADRITLKFPPYVTVDVPKVLFRNKGDFETVSGFLKGKARGA